MVSIIIPAHNSGRTLGAALDSMLAQTYPATEIIVVDDGSTDETPEVLRAYGSRITVLRQSRKGLPGARNAGCAAAKGEFVALMDADDISEPERIAIQAQALELFSSAVLCSSDFSAFSETGPISSSHCARYYSAIANAENGLLSLYSSQSRLTSGQGGAVDVFCGDVYDELAFGNFVHPPTVMFRRSALNGSGVSDERLRYTSDWEWFVRMARCGDFVHIALPLLAYRISDAQMSTWTHNRGQGALDIVRAADMIWSADPDLRQRHAARVERHRREFCLGAAYALSTSHKRQALRMLVESIRHGERSVTALRIALKIALPAQL